MVGIKGDMRFSDALERMHRARIKGLGGVDREDAVALAIAGEVAMLKGDMLAAVTLAVAAAQRFKAVAEVCASKEMGDAIKKGGSEREIKKRYIDLLKGKKK